MMNEKILLVGGGGHCKSVLDSLLNLHVYSEIGIIDIRENVGKNVLSKKIIGTDDDLQMLYENGYRSAFITVGSLGNTDLRRKLFKLIEGIGYSIPQIIDSTATISESASIDKGVFIGKNVVINAGAVIGLGSIINTGAIIEHDCMIDKFAHIAPGAVICGNVKIGENTHIGAKSVVKQQVRIGMDSIIGMGSVVLNDISANSIAYGNPCMEKF